MSNKTGIVSANNLKANAAAVPQKSSSAYKYDFDLFEARAKADEYELERMDRQRRTDKKKAAALKQKREAEVRNELAMQKRERMKKASQRQKQRSAVIRGMALGVLVVSLVISLLCYMSMHELTAKVSKETRRYNELMQEHDAMMVSIESSLSSIMVEEYAIGLGMQRREANQTHWVSISNGDIFEIASGHSEPEPAAPDILSFFGR